MVLLDSNILIYYLQDVREVVPFVEYRGKVWISIISYIELLGNKKFHDKEFQRIKNFLQTFQIVHIESPIADKAALFRREGLKLGDAVIAASAWWLQIPLVTRDHVFKRVHHIKMIDPFL